MKVKSLSAGKSIEVMGGWYKCSVEVELGENENPHEAFREAKSLVDKWLPGVNQDIVREEEKPEATPEEALIQIIDLCHTVSLLERQRGQVERMKSQKVTERFESKLKQLQV